MNEGEPWKCSDLACFSVHMDHAHVSSSVFSSQCPTEQVQSRRQVGALGGSSLPRAHCGAERGLTPLVVPALGGAVFGWSAATLIDRRALMGP